MAINWWLLQCKQVWPSTVHAVYHTDHQAWPRISESMFIRKENRTEFICNHRQSWSYWQTRSIAWPLCDSRATCFCLSYCTASAIIIGSNKSRLLTHLVWSVYDDSYDVWCCVWLHYSQFIDVSVLDGGWSERPEQMARAKRYRWLYVFSSVINFDKKVFRNVQESGFDHALVSVWCQEGHSACKNTGLAFYKGA